MRLCIKHAEMAVKLCQQQHKRRWFYLIISRKSVGHMMGSVELTIELPYKYFCMTKVAIYLNLLMMIILNNLAAVNKIPNVCQPIPSHH